MALDNLALKAIGIVLGLVVVRLTIAYFCSPLKAIPGPFVAKFTDLWRFYDYWCCTHTHSHQALHKKHGPAVRIGPNMVSLSDPDLLKQVYSTRGDFVKSEFYEVADASSEGQRLENVFSTRSNYDHSRYLKPYQKYFSMNAILAKEHLADSIAQTMCRELEARFVDGANAGKTVDLADWIEYAAWDFDWEMSFGQDMGFLRTGTDVQGLIHTGEMVIRYLGCVGQIPWLDRLLGKNPYCPIKFATFDSTAYYSYQRVMERIASPEKRGSGDFLDNFLEAKETHPDIVSDNEVVTYLLMNVLAGADTTAIIMKSITWYILSNPAVHARLVAELDAAGLSSPPQYEQTRDLSYLDAVIREGMRMHPVISGILERIVPPTGLTLADGRVIAPGTKIGLSTWVTSRNAAIWGADPETFNPDRWLQAAGEPDGAFAARLKRMKDADMTFGGGNRICVGRHMANVEIHKLITTLFSRYQIKLDDSRKQWTVRFWWFPFIDNIQVKLERRPGVAEIKA